MDNKTVICLMGPTASGKTGLAIRLVRRLNLQIISVDSALVYRGLNIGAAKPTAEELRQYPHRLIDIRDPEDTYSAGDFVRDAEREIDAIHAAGDTPLLVGGTMMYFRALVHGIAELPAADPEIRAQLDAEAEAHGWAALHTELAAVDEQAAARINPNDGQRIQRALEVFRQSGKSLTEWQSQTRPRRSDYEFVRFALVPEPRSTLHERIEKRLDEMLDNGAVDEVRNLMKRRGLSAANASMKSVGYRQIWRYLDGEYDFATARRRALEATRQLAKHQLTWIRNDTEIQVLNPLEADPFATISGCLESKGVATKTGNDRQAL